MSKVKVTVSGVLRLLEKGMSRDEIGEELGLSKRDVKLLFQHPDLKGRKAKKPVGFILVDEIEEEEEEISEEGSLQLELPFEDVDEDLLTLEKEDVEEDLLTLEEEEEENTSNENINSFFKPLG